MQKRAAWPPLLSSYICLYEDGDQEVSVPLATRRPYGLQVDAGSLAGTRASKNYTDTNSYTWLACDIISYSGTMA